MRVLLARLDAPLISFGGTAVDARGVTDVFPARSMVAGLVGNALGYDHRDVGLLSRLQQRLVIGARMDREGIPVVDFQTVDLGQPFLREGWTTDGRVEGREGGTAGVGTHIRWRHYLADAVYTVALTLTPEAEAPMLEDLQRAFEAPARPLFIGRKCCIPSEPLALGIVETGSLLDALATAPLSARAASGRKLVRVPRSEARDGFRGAERAITESRDWANQIHVGRSIVLEGMLELRQEVGS